MKYFLLCALSAFSISFANRYYDSDLGMWISTDPARQFASPYVYTGNGYNPVNSIDPDGRAIIKSRGLGENGNADNVYGPLRHDQIFFDQPTLIGKKLYNNIGFFGDNGILSIPGVYRSERGNHVSYIDDYVDMGWVPDRFVAMAVKRYSANQRYSLGLLDCQNFAKNVFEYADELFRDEVKMAAEKNPFIVDLISEDSDD